MQVEGTIRGFCIGKANWYLNDTLDVAKASEIIYSIAETAKANYLKPYFEYLLDEISKHIDDKNLDFTYLQKHYLYFQEISTVQIVLF